ncbi:MAG: ABC transporter permease [Clostridium baratii]|uniref:ABC transporter permease n=1 Tax=Clostridium baratii TaxID=1561 RepID=UPI00242DEB52|nr:ABC transporter permease [Clostridium baratii]MBS6007101.1 ABC transporter permease [Clostridium baratii]
MSVFSLIIASFLLIIPISISYKQKLHLEKELIISILRAIIQLVAVGYILEWVFNVRNSILTTVLVLIMIFNAAFNTKKRGEGIKNVVLISFISLIIGAFITLFVLVLSGAISYTPNDIIPIAGMIVSNSMIAIGLSYTNLRTSFKTRRSEVEVKLSLGADINCNLLFIQRFL